MRTLTLALFLALPALAEFRRIDLTLYGMDGAAEAHAVRTALSRLEGVESVEISLAEGTAVLRLAAGNQLRMEKVLRAVEGVALETRRIRVEPPDMVPKLNSRWQFEAAKGKPAQWEVPRGRHPLGTVRLFQKR